MRAATTSSCGPSAIDAGRQPTGPRQPTIESARRATAASASAEPIAQTALAGMLMLARGFPHWLHARRRRAWEPHLPAPILRDARGQTLEISEHEYMVRGRGYAAAALRDLIRLLLERGRHEARLEPALIDQHLADAAHSQGVELAGQREQVIGGQRRIAVPA